MIAARWAKGRVFLAGDAAHQTPPFMGQGMCAGLRDAANLGWKIGGVLDHRLPRAVLQSYQSERERHVEAFIELTMNLGRVINATARAITTGDFEAAREGAQQIRIIRPRLGPGLEAGDTDLRGTTFQQLKLDGRVRIDDAHAYRCYLVLGAGASSGVRAAFNGEGIDVVPARAPEIISWLEKHGVAAALVRPDRAILGTVDDPDRVGELLPANWRFATG